MLKIMKSEPLVTVAGVRAIFRFNFDLRNALLDALSGWTWEEVVENREIGHHSVRNTILHILECEDFGIHHLLAGRGLEWKDYDYEAVTDFGALRDRCAELEARTCAYLNGLTDARLATVVELRPEGQAPQSYGTENMLLNIVFEEMHHRGELLALFHQRDRPVPEPMHWNAHAWLVLRGGRNPSEVPGVTCDRGIQT